MNPDFETIGKTFVQEYYKLFDGDVNQRTAIANFYSETDSFLTFEGAPFMGKIKIAEKLNGLGFQKIQHLITTCDCQPTVDGGVVVMVSGQLKTDSDHPHGFIQTFVLKSRDNTFFVQHDLFRLVLGQ